MLYDLTVRERANRSALLLVQERYSNQLASFVKQSKVRRAYVEKNIASIIDDVCEETGANKEYVTARFNEFLSAILDPVLTDDAAKQEKLTNPDPDAPYTKNEDAKVKLDGVVEADVMDRGDVENAGREEALTPDAKVDLGQETAPYGAESEVEYKTSKCFRCDSELEAKVAKHTPVCFSCTAELLKLADNLPGSEFSYGYGAGAEEPTVQEEPSVNPNMPYVCTLCGREGSREDVASHINREHSDVLQRQLTEAPANMGQNPNPMDLVSSIEKQGWDTTYTILVSSAAAIASGLITYLQYQTYKTYDRINDTYDRIKDINNRITQQTYEQLQRKYQNVDDTTLQQATQEGVQQALQKEQKEQTYPPLTSAVDEESEGDLAAQADRLAYEHMKGLHDRQEDPDCPICLEEYPNESPYYKQFFTKKKIADVPQDDQNTAEVPPLPENPGDRFDDYVQRLAETAAARKFSMPSDEDIHSIASQIGASPDDVKNNLITTAVYGDQVAVNGEIGQDPNPPEGYEEISAQNLSGQQPTHDAVVPTDLVISSVAKDMNMPEDLTYTMVKDKYGADLPSRYHASVSGQVHYYLPSGMAGNQPPPTQQNPQVGPTAPPAPQAMPQQQPQQPMTPTM